MYTYIHINININMNINIRIHLHLHIHRHMHIHRHRHTHAHITSHHIRSHHITSNMYDIHIQQMRFRWSVKIYSSKSLYVNEISHHITPSSTPPFFASSHRRKQIRARRLTFRWRNNWFREVNSLVSGDFHWMGIIAWWWKYGKILLIAGWDPQ